MQAKSLVPTCAFFLSIIALLDCHTTRASRPCGTEPASGSPTGAKPCAYVAGVDVASTAWSAGHWRLPGPGQMLAGVGSARVAARRRLVLRKSRKTGNTSFATLAPMKGS